MTYPFLDNWGRTSLRLSDRSYIDLRDPDYTSVPLWCLAEAVCYEYRYAGQGRRKLHVGEHLLAGAALARKVAEIGTWRGLEALLNSQENPLAAEKLLAQGFDEPLSFGGIDPLLAERAFLAHDLHEGVTNDATRGMKHLNPMIEEIERTHYTRLRARLGLPGPGHRVWALQKWVDKKMCLNEIAQMWEEPIPLAESHFLVGDPELPIELRFLSPQEGAENLINALERVGWPCR